MIIKKKEGIGMGYVTAYEYAWYEWECPHCGHRNREDYVSVDYEDESSEVVCENCEETSQVTRIKIE